MAELLDRDLSRAVNTREISAPIVLAGTRCCTPRTAVWAYLDLEFLLIERRAPLSRKAPSHPSPGDAPEHDLPPIATMGTAPRDLQRAFAVLPFDQEPAAELPFGGERDRAARAKPVALVVELLAQRYARRALVAPSPRRCTRARGPPRRQAMHRRDQPANRGAAPSEARAACGAARTIHRRQIPRPPRAPPSPARADRCGIGTCAGGPAPRGWRRSSPRAWKAARPLRAVDRTSRAPRASARHSSSAPCNSARAVRRAWNSWLFDVPASIPSSAPISL